MCPLFIIGTYQKSIEILETTLAKPLNILGPIRPIIFSTRKDSFLKKCKNASFSSELHELSTKRNLRKLLNLEIGTALALSQASYTVSNSNLRFVTCLPSKRHQVECGNSRKPSCETNNHENQN
jgi:hypothetical protein